MGQTLSTPATEKHSKAGGNERFIYAISEMQGWRISMEDAHAIELELDAGKKESNTFFAVYDGHGGGTVAKFSGANVHKRLVKEESYQEKKWEYALKRAFLGTDEDIRADPAFFRDPSGCTAVAALLTPEGRVFVANAGDSRAVLSVKGEVKPLSFDHKPTNESETTRIRNAGGYVEYGRVNGNLALSRAIGDFDFKKNYALTPEEQAITANPDVSEHQLSDEDEFLVLACDGIWDCLSSQQVVDIIRLQVSQKIELTEICENICDLCLAPDASYGGGVGCDNMTVLIIAILNGRTKEQWYDWISDRVERHYGYDTPSTIPQIYDQYRINAARSRRQAYQERMERERDGVSSWRGPTTAFGMARSMLGGGISMQRSTGTDDGPLVISAADDSDEDDSGDENPDADGDGEGDESGEANGWQSYGWFNAFLDSAREKAFLAREAQEKAQREADVTKSLKAQLDELEEGSSDPSLGRRNFDDEGDSFMSDPDDTFGTGSIGPDDKAQSRSNPNFTGRPAVSESPAPTSRSRASLGLSDHSREETPPPPARLPNGDANPQKQLHSLPLGDKPDPVVRAEGLLDKSEDPTKTAT